MLKTRVPISALVAITLCLLWPHAALPSAEARAPAAPNERFEQPWLGVRLSSVGRAVRIEEVIEGSPAALTGLMVGDRVLRIADQAVSVPADVVIQVSRMSVGDEARIRVQRESAVLDLEVVLMAKISAAELLRRRLEGKPAPDFRLPIVGGRGEQTSLSSSQFRGKILVLEFWATWCESCASVHELLNAAITKSFAGTKADLAVVGLSAEPPPLIRKYLRLHRLAYPVVVDRFANVRARYYASSLPTLVVIDRDGIVRYAGAGAGDNAHDAIAIAQSLLADD